MEIKIPRQARDGFGLNRKGWLSEGWSQSSARTPKAVNAVNEFMTCGGTLHALPPLIKKLCSVNRTPHQILRYAPAGFFVLLIIQVCLFS